MRLVHVSWCDDNFSILATHWQSGHLLTSDNYDDTEKKVVGGRNGEPHL